MLFCDHDDVFLPTTVVSPVLLLVGFALFSAVLSSLSMTVATDSGLIDSYSPPCLLSFPVQDVRMGVVFC